MSYSQNLKKLIFVLVFTAVAPILVPHISSAQQVTAPTVPSTQSPQATQTGSIPATGSVQQSSASKVLDTATDLSIPAGQPATPSDIETIDEPSDRSWLIAPLALLIGIGSGTWLLVNRSTRPLYTSAEVELFEESHITKTVASPKPPKAKKPKQRAKSTSRSGKKKKKK